MQYDTKLQSSQPWLLLTKHLSATVCTIFQNTTQLIKRKSRHACLQRKFWQKSLRNYSHIYEANMLFLMLSMWKWRPGIRASSSWFSHQKNTFHTVTSTQPWHPLRISDAKNTRRPHRMMGCVTWLQKGNQCWNDGRVSGKEKDEKSRAEQREEEPEWFPSVSSSSETAVMTSADVFNYRKKFILT